MFSYVTRIKGYATGVGESLSGAATDVVARCSGIIGIDLPHPVHLCLVLVVTSLSGAATDVLIARCSGIKSIGSLWMGGDQNAQ